MLRRIVLSALGLLLVFGSDSYSAEPGLRKKMRIVSGKVNKVDYEKKSFRLSGVRSAGLDSEINLNVERSTKGLEFIQASATLTVLFDETDNLAIRIGLTGPDAIPTEEGESDLNTVDLGKSNKSTASAKSKKKKKDDSGSSGSGSSMSGIAPPSGSKSVTLNRKTIPRMGGTTGSGSTDSGGTPMGGDTGTMPGTETPPTSPPANPGDPISSNGGAGVPGDGTPPADAPPGDTPPGDGDPGTPPADAPPGDEPSGDTPPGDEPPADMPPGDGNPPTTTDDPPPPAEPPPERPPREDRPTPTRPT